MHPLLLPGLRLIAAFGTLALIAILKEAVPTNMRPEPVQRLDFPQGGGALWLPDPSHSEHYIPDPEASCPNAMLLIMLGVGGIFAAIINCQSREACVDACAVYLAAQGVSGSVVQWLKNYCGYLRPNFLGGCAYNATVHACAVPFSDGRHSFPSGHTSSSATAATVLTLYLLRGLVAQPAKTGYGVWLQRACAAAVPLPGVIAAWVGASRVRDNWHFPADVAAGGAIGAATGALAFACATHWTPALKETYLMAGAQPAVRLEVGTHGRPTNDM